MRAAELFDLTGQVALVTGASSGLGVRFAEVLAANGAAVALVARRAERLAAVKDRIGENGGRAVAIAADVLDRAAMGHAFDAAEAAFGTVTVLVNNAGVTHADRASLIAYSVAKAGVVQLTKGLALELAFKGVRVNAIAPGYVVTEINREFLAAKGAEIARQIPAGRLGEERDLDGALLLLASDAGRFMAGATIVVDGGQMVALRG